MLVRLATSRVPRWTVVLAVSFLVGCGGGSAPESSNAFLASLTTSSSRPLVPAFDPSVTAYTVGIVTEPSVVVTPTAQDAHAVITVQGTVVASGAASAAVPLAIGVTTIEVVLRAEDGTTRTYRIAVDRTSAELANLETSAGPLEPPFQSAVLSYTVGPAFLPESVTVTPTAADPNATIRVNTGPTVSGTPSLPIPLAVGLTPVTVEVTARDGTTLTTYTVVFERSTIPEEAYLKVSNAGWRDFFGSSVAISGDTLVVGAPNEASSATGGPNDDSRPGAGAVYVFVRTGTTWTQQAYLKASNAGPDYFGASVALSGDTLVVGAPYESASAEGGPTDDSAWGAGAAYVFTRTGTTWTQQAYLKASNAESRDAFGTSVAISGDTVVVGAYAEASSATGGPADNSKPGAGAAYVFTRVGTTWTSEAFLKASNPAVNDMFGVSVAISGDTVAVGAAGVSSVPGGPPSYDTFGMGAAHVFTRTGTTWSEQARLQASNAQAGDFFGISVALSDDTLVAGAYHEGSSATGGESDESQPWSGAAYVFTRAGSAWTQQARLKAANAEGVYQYGDEFGTSVAISGGTVVVGAPHESGSATGGEADNSAAGAGAAYVFGRTGTTWTQRTRLKAANADPYDDFGYRVAIDLDTVVAGARYEDSSATGGPDDDGLPDAGAAYVYR